MFNSLSHNSSCHILNAGKASVVEQAGASTTSILSKNFAEKGGHSQQSVLMDKYKQQRRLHQHSYNNIPNPYSSAQDLLRGASQKTIAETQPPSGSMTNQRSSQTLINKRDSAQKKLPLASVSTSMTKFTPTHCSSPRQQSQRKSSHAGAGAGGGSNSKNLQNFHLHNRINSFGQAPATRLEGEGR